MLHTGTLPGNPYDGHTLDEVIDGTETLTGGERAYVHKSYRGQNREHPHRLFISGQKRAVFGVIKRESKCASLRMTK